MLGHAIVIEHIECGIIGLLCGREDSGCLVTIEEVGGLPT